MDRSFEAGARTRAEAISTLNSAASHHLRGIRCKGQASFVPSFQSVFCKLTNMVRRFVCLRPDNCQAYVPVSRGAPLQPLARLYLFPRQK